VPVFKKHLHRELFNIYLTTAIHLPSTLIASILYLPTLLLLDSVLTATSQSSPMQGDLYVPACIVKTSEDTRTLFCIGHRQGEVYTTENKI